MIEFIYQTLTKLGYTHPLHPTLTHVPIGMVMGAFLFVLVALIFRRTNLAQSAFGKVYQFSKTAPGLFAGEQFEGNLLKNKGG